MTNDNKTQRVRSILNKKWNPIGLSLNELDDEYDDYVEYIIQRPVWQEKELADYLIYVEGSHIGLSVDKERKNIAYSVAKEIMAVM